MRCAWSRVAELAVDRNETPVSLRIARLTRFGELVHLHIEDMVEDGKPPRRSKAATLDMLQREIGAVRINAPDCGRLIRFGRAFAAFVRDPQLQFGRTRSGPAGKPGTVEMAVETIVPILLHAPVVHAAPISMEQAMLTHGVDAPKIGRQAASTGARGCEHRSTAPARVAVAVDFDQVDV